MDALQKRLPYSLDAEQSVLGSILIDPECFDEVAQIIRQDDFYLETHGQIFGLMQSYSLQSKNIDVITLINSLVANKIYEDETVALYTVTPQVNITLKSNFTFDSSKMYMNI